MQQAFLAWPRRFFFLRSRRFLYTAPVPRPKTRNPGIKYLYVHASIKPIYAETPENIIYLYSNLKVSSHVITTNFHHMIYIYISI